MRITTVAKGDLDHASIARQLVPEFGRSQAGYSSEYPVGVVLNDFGEPYVGGWWVGLIVGSAVVVVVVVVVAAVLVFASQINEQVRIAARELEAARVTTRPLVELGRTNGKLQSILSGARTAREALGG